VKEVGALYRAELDALGFTTRWVEMPAEMQRAGHLVAERIGKHAGKTPRRMLLLGHFDTVFEGAGQRFVREDSIARGAGTTDMKGGDAILLFALKALEANRLLDRISP
jgi:glutamate carboxypeptidase